jgi:hypothetical protein
MKFRLLIAVGVLGFAAQAKPPAAQVFCSTYPSSPLCQGQTPACTLCHVQPPSRNIYGQALEAQLAVGAPRPLSDGDFTLALPMALRGVEAADTDGDGKTNRAEIDKGTLPGDSTSVFQDQDCSANSNSNYNLCAYDTRYTYRKLLLDFCGESPSFTEVQTFELLSETARRSFLDSELDRCLATEFWIGKNGQLWRIAHAKIRPVGSLKSGEDQGQIPLADYYDDYGLFTFTQTGDRDAREILTADYFVQRNVNPTSYVKVANKGSQYMAVSKRAGVMTSTWSLIYYVMFTALPRNAASQMYRAYLGLDIAKQEGLFSVANEPRDYDNKGVRDVACAACHATLDPLSYPFRNYNGIDGRQSAQYLPNRIEKNFANQAPNITQIPEAGAIFAQPVANLHEWGVAASNSDAFAISTTTDYWKFLFGRPPNAQEQVEFLATWKRFKTTHQWRVQKMLHDLIRTEAYGAP